MNEEPLSEKGFERKLKRLVIGREHRWLASVQKPFAPIAFDELTALGAGKPELSGEGVRFFTDLAGIYSLHLRAATVSRFWLIVDTFHARSREELFAKVHRIPWELFLDTDLPVRTRSMVRRSTLRHEGETARTVTHAIERRLAAARLSAVELPGMPHGSQPGCAPAAGKVPGSGKEQLVEVCVIDNRCELRLDASGAHLHKRGYRVLTEAAPIRETTAAALLRWAVEKAGMPDLFLDPMCGSGTFPVEMWGLSRNVSLAASRRYAFMDWPGFRPRTWRHLERKAAEEREKAVSGSRPAAGARESQSVGEPVPRYGRYPLVLASDISSRAVSDARRNAESLGIERGMVFSTGDFFDLREGSFPEIHEYDPSGRATRFLCANPPYGKRLPVPSAAAGGAGRESAEAELHRRILSHCRAAFPGWRILMLVPRYAVPEDLAGFFRVESFPFTNGGIPLLALLLEQKKRPVP